MLVARGQLQRAPLMRVGIEVVLRTHTALGRGFSGENPRAGHLPGDVSDLARDGALLHSSVRAHVLEESAKRSSIIESLGRHAPARSVTNDPGRVAVEHVQTRRPERW